MAKSFDNGGWCDLEDADRLMGAFEEDEVVDLAEQVLDNAWPQVAAIAAALLDRGTLTYGKWYASSKMTRPSRVDAAPSSAADTWDRDSGEITADRQRLEAATLTYDASCAKTCPNLNAMARRRSNPPSPAGPPQLVYEPDEARRVVRELLDEGHALLANAQLPLMDLEQFEADCKKWKTKAHDHLERMWDQDRYAESFAWKGHYGATSRYDSPQQRFNRDHESLRDQIHDLESQLDRIDNAAKAPPRKPATISAPERSEVVVYGGNVGITIASQARDIRTIIQTVSGPSAEEVKRLTEAFADSLAGADAIDGAERDEGLEQLKFVATAAAQSDRPRMAILQPIVDRLGLIAKGSTAVHDLYEQWAPAITALLRHVPS